MQTVLPGFDKFGIRPEPSTGRGVAPPKTGWFKLLNTTFHPTVPSFELPDYHTQIPQLPRYRHTRYFRSRSTGDGFEGHRVTGNPEGNDYCRLLVRPGYWQHGEEQPRTLRRVASNMTERYMWGWRNGEGGLEPAIAVVLYSYATPVALGTLSSFREPAREATFMRVGYRQDSRSVTPARLSATTQRHLNRWLPTNYGEIVQVTPLVLRQVIRQLRDFYRTYDVSQAIHQGAFWNYVPQEDPFLNW